MTTRNKLERCLTQLLLAYHWFRCNLLFIAHLADYTLFDGQGGLMLFLIGIMMAFGKLLKRPLKPSSKNN